MSEDLEVKEDEEEESGKTFNCPICLCDVPKEEVFYVKRCGCGFCQACLTQFVRLNIDERTIQRLKCPSTHSLDFPLLRDEVKSLVSREAFLNYIRLQYENAILQDPTRVFCPRPECGAVCYSSGRLGARPIRCMTCGYKFCRLCFNRWPGRGHICPEDLPITAALKSSGSSLLPGPDGSTADGPSITPAPPEEPATTEETATGPNGEEIEVKRCPKCGVPIQRRAGCAHMRCARCGHSFCWFCLANLDHDYFLHHFESGPCRAALGHPRAAVHIYRLSAICIICGLSTLAMLCAPFAILCSPCIVLCAPRLPQCLFPNDGSDTALSANSLLNEAADDDTDSEMDPEEQLVT